MGESEAGPSCVLSFDGSQVQRRHLWTDSFGIMNYVSLCMSYKRLGNQIKAQQSLLAAKSLINSVFEVLGSPRSQSFPMSMNFDGRVKGLRNGTLYARNGNSDVGNDFDGIFFHCLDKFILALCRSFIHS